MFQCSVVCQLAREARDCFIQHSAHLSENKTHKHPHVNNSIQLYWKLEQAFFISFLPFPVFCQRYPGQSLSLVHRFYSSCGVFTPLACSFSAFASKNTTARGPVPFSFLLITAETNVVRSWRSQLLSPWLAFFQAIKYHFLSGKGERRRLASNETLSKQKGR